MNLELLAPAGNMEKMKVALAFGADAVYAGIPDFSLRVRINDFNFEKIKIATKYCHERNKKIYITTNIFAHNKHLDKLPAYIEKLKEIQIDALIVSDPGIMNLIREVWPEAEIHLSTQANCTNWQSAKFWYDAGVSRIVLGREVSLGEIKEIHKKLPKLELEYFVHGAMCMAYSGRCFLSKMYMNRSANLGDCIQPCRWEHSVSIKNEELRIKNSSKSHLIQAKGHDEVLELVEEEHGSYILNSKDLCLVRHLKDLVDAGIVSFKIEGRAKSVYYQAMVSGIYSSALKNIKNIDKSEIDFLYSELETKLVHRGYTEGFLLGEKADQNLDNSHIKCDWEYCGEVINGRDAPWRVCAKEVGQIVVKVHNSLKVGDKIEIVRPMYDILKMKVEKMIDPDTGEKLNEAHGGQERAVFLEVPEDVPAYSVVRRKL
jgi:putative protease